MATPHVVGYTPRWILSIGFVLVIPLQEVSRAALPSGLGSAWIADTATPDALQTLVLPLGPEVGERNAGRLQFELGFATFEAPAIGFLYDSLSLSLARADGSGSTILATGDVFGLTLAPLAPGGLLAGGGISATEVPPSIPTPTDAEILFAYRVEVNLPPSLQGVGLRTTFDFFNNGDGIASQGYALVVPEPMAWYLLAPAAAVGLAGWRRIRRNS